MKRFAMAALLALACHSAHALTLEQARSEGRVGETLGGYLAPLT